MSDEALAASKKKLESQYLSTELEEDAGYWDQWVRAIARRTGHLEPMPLPEGATTEQKNIIGNMNKKVEANNAELKRLYGKKSLSISTESHGQHVMRLVGGFGGLFPLFTEGSLSIPVPEAAKAGAAIAFEKAKGLTSISEAGDSSLPLAPLAFAGGAKPGANLAWHLLSRQFEGEVDEGKVEALKQVYDQKRKEGNWITTGELFLGQTPEARGRTRDDWVSRSMESFEQGDDAVSIFTRAATKQGYEPKYSGFFGHLQGALEGDPYSTAAAAGLLFEFLPVELGVTKPYKMGKRMASAISDMPFMKGTSPERAMEALIAMKRTLKGTEVDIAAAQIAKRRELMANGKYKFTDEPPEIKRNLKVLSEALEGPIDKRQAPLKKGKKGKKGKRKRYWEESDALERLATTARVPVEGIRPTRFEKTKGGLEIEADGLTIETSVDGGEWRAVKPGPPARDADVELINKVFGITYQPSKLAEAMYVAETTGIGSTPTVAAAPGGVPPTPWRGLPHGGARPGWLRQAPQRSTRGVGNTTRSRRIIESALMALEPLSSAAKREGKLIGKARMIELNPKEIEELSHVAVKYDIPNLTLKDGKYIRRGDDKAFSNALITKMAGESAKDGYYVRQTPGLVSMARTLLDVVPAEWARRARKVKRQIDSAAALVVNVERSKLPKPARVALERMYRKLGNNYADMIREMTEVRRTTKNPVTLMRKLMGGEVELLTEGQMKGLRNGRRRETG